MEDFKEQSNLSFFKMIYLFTFNIKIFENFIHNKHSVKCKHFSNKIYFIYFTLCSYWHIPKQNGKETFAQNISKNNQFKNKSKLKFERSNLLQS